MKYHIGYYGGAGGDFLRGLIVSGLNDIETKFENNTLYSPVPHWIPVIKLLDNGKIEVVGPIEADDDRYRVIQLGHDVGEPITQVGHYFNQCTEAPHRKTKRNIEKFQQFIFDYAKSKACESNGWKSKTSISVGHEHIGFLHTFKRLQEFYVHMNDYRKNDKVIYITINTQEEADQRFLNNTNKNNPNNTDWERKSHFWHHRRIYKKVIEQKQSCDMILPMRYIYKKEYLREWLRKEFDWNDRCYDALYDAWYSKQDVIL